MTYRFAHSIGFVLLLAVSSCNEEPAQFTLISSRESGIDFRNELVETEHNNIMTYEYSYNGGGVAVGDVNGDNLPDVYFTGNTVPNKLYINKGDMTFVDVTVESGTAGRPDWKTGVTMADVNGDGLLDIYVCYSGNAPEEGYEKPVIRDHPKRANELFINNGADANGIPTFTESAAEYGLDAPGSFSTQAYFLDYDLDGDLDMFLLNHANMFYSAFLNTRRLRNLRHPYFGNRLYRNDSGEKQIKFTDVSDAAGIHGSGLNFGLSAAISDLNGDRYPDIYVTNDYEEQDFCYINNHDGTFTEVSKILFSHLSKYGMGSDIADINNDGLPDLIVLDMLPEDNKRQKLLKGPDEYDRYALAVDSGFHHQYMRNTLQINRGFASDTLPRFSEIGQFAGISNTDWSWAPLAADFDNDGLKDLFVSNGFLRDFNNLDFIKYNAHAFEEARSSRRSVDYLKLVQQLPSTRIPNYIFRNENGVSFTNRSAEWGLAQPSVSNGAAYADFDNDGDLDLVTNNLDGEAFIYRNNTERIQHNNFLKIRLKGESPNTYGIGAKVIVAGSRQDISHEVHAGRGYQSSIEPVLTIGVGDAESLVVDVYWPDGRHSTIPNVTANTTIEVSQSTATTGGNAKPEPNKIILTDAGKGSGLDFVHRENNYIDFKVQRLLHYQVSRLGGKIAKGDVNGDGNDDLFFCGAVGQPGTLYIGKTDGTFIKAAGQPWVADSASEDADAIFFDADSDGDVDLFVLSGGGEFVSSAPMYKHRLYINNGRGIYTKATEGLPDISSSGGVVTVGDFDRDGDVDLFIGGRLVPGSYGYIPRSYLLRNDSEPERVMFSDVTLEHDKALQSPGMVTSALWTDYNGDGWQDLIVTGEWMPIRLFENRQGKLEEHTGIASLANLTGWWCSIFEADIDGDGDPDYLLGNAGTNTQFRPTETQPIELFAADFNQDGVTDPVITYYIQGKSYPLATRDELLDQLPNLKKKFVKYETYADATIQEIGTSEQIERAARFTANRLESSWIENLGGADFKIHTLPPQAQWSPINGFVYDDFDGDGRKEIIATGNFFPFKPQLGRNDASFGISLYYDNKKLVTHESSISELWLGGDIRDIEVLHFRSGMRRIIASRNDDAPAVFAPIADARVMVAGSRKSN